MTYGITPAGFTRPRLVDIQQQIFAKLVLIFGAQINQLPESIFSQLVGTFSEREDLVWQAMEDVYNSQYPDLATGVSLDNAASLTGAVRKGPLPSTLTGQLLFGTPGTLIPAGKQVAVLGSPTSIFATNNDVTLVAGQDCVQTLTPLRIPNAGHFNLSLDGQATPDLPYNATAAAVQAALNALPFGTGITVAGDLTTQFTVTFTGAAGKQVQAALVVGDNTLADGTGAITLAVTVTVPGINQGSVDMTAVADGPTLAPAGELTQIVTPVNGWDSTINPLDATAGRLMESDNAFKQRRRAELQIAGDATVEAIRSKLLQLSDVTTAIVFENDTMITDGSGRPAKSIEAMVEGGTDAEILQTVFDTKAAGIQAYGNTCGNVTDSQGQVHNICFSRPDPVLIYIKITITKNPSFPVDGVATVQQELADFGNALGIGKEVVVTPYLISSIANIPGIEDAVLLIGIAPNPTMSDNIAIAANEVAQFDTSRIQVITV